MKRLKAIEKVMFAAPEQQVSFTDPDSRSMATSGRGSGMVGYNVQVAVDTTNHLIVAHEVTNVGTDKSHLANMANQAKAALEAESLEAFAVSHRTSNRRRWMKSDGYSGARAPDYSHTASPARIPNGIQMSDLIHSGARY